MSYVDMSAQYITQETHKRYAHTLSQPEAIQTWLSQLWALLNALHFSGEQISPGPAQTQSCVSSFWLLYESTGKTVLPLPSVYHVFLPHLLSTENVWTRVRDVFTYRGYEQDHLIV